MEQKDWEKLRAVSPSATVSKEYIDYTEDEVATVVHDCMKELGVPVYTWQTVNAGWGGNQETRKMLVINVHFGTPVDTIEFKRKLDILGYSLNKEFAGAKTTIIIGALTYSVFEGAHDGHSELTLDEYRQYVGNLVQDLEYHGRILTEMLGKDKDTEE